MKVLRSTVGPTHWVHQRLNDRRAITLCCRPNSASSSKSMTTAWPHGAAVPTSTDVGTRQLAVKPIR